MLVRELMTKDLVTVTPSTSVKQAVRVLDEHHLTSAPVLDKSGRLVGVVSEADLIRDLVASDARAHVRPLDDRSQVARPRDVGEVMSPHVICVHPDDDLADAVELITTTTVKSVPVVDEGVVVGVLSRSDVVRVLARADDQIALDVDTLFGSAGLEEWIADVSDGYVSLSGPEDPQQRAVARLLAGTVPGVVDVSS